MATSTRGGASFSLGSTSPTSSQPSRTTSVAPPQNRHSQPRGATEEQEEEKEEEVEQEEEDGDEEYTNEDEDEDYSSTLPFPVPLPRTAFSSPCFSPSTFLTTLHNRHQTLSDLRSELQSLSAAVAAELHALVNAEYAAFATLGSSLRGADDRLDGLRVGLLRFDKGVSAVLELVRERRHATTGLLAQRESLVGDIGLARALIEIAARIEELEVGLAVGGLGGVAGASGNGVASASFMEDSNGADGSSGDDDDDEEDEDGGEEEDDGDDKSPAAAAVRIGRLRRYVRGFVAVQRQANSIGPDHPFLKSQEDRLNKIKNTLLLDLGTALKAARAAEASRKAVDIMSLYADIGEEAEAVKVLREARRR